MEQQGDVDLSKRIKYAQGYRVCNQCKGPRYPIKDDEEESFEDEKKREKNLDKNMEAKEEVPLAQVNTATSMTKGTKIGVEGDLSVPGYAPDSHVIISQVHTVSEKLGLRHTPCTSLQL